MFRECTLLDACDFPSEVEDWCVDQQISTHYENAVTSISDDGNPMATWLKENGYEFKSESDWFAILAT